MTDQQQRLEDVFKRYRILRLRSASEGTLRLYAITFRMLRKYLGRPATLADLTDEEISGFAIWRKDQGASPATVNRDLTNILAIWRWCHRQRLVERWPNIQLEKERVRTPTAWSEDQFNQILRAAARTKGYLRETQIRWCDWWSALLLLAFDTGERIGAILDVDWKDIDLQQRFVRFPAESRKGRTKDHMLEFSVETGAAIERIAGKRQKVFLFPYSVSYLWVRYGRILEMARLPNDRQRKFHAIRRTTASHFEAAGGDATRLLGHAFRRTTEAYLDPRIVKVKPAHSLLFKPRSGFLQPDPEKPTTDEENRAAARSLMDFLITVYAARKEIAVLNSHRYSVTCIEAFTKKKLRIGDLTNSLLAEWYRYEATDKSVSSAQSLLGCILAMWRAAFDWKFVVTTPDTSLIVPPSPEDPNVSEANAKRTCKECGASIADRHPSAVFCSPRCRGRDSWRRKKEEMGAREDAFCRHCGGPLPENSSRNQLYCSRGCRNAVAIEKRAAKRERTTDLLCVRCGATLPNDSRSDRRYCSRSCANAAFFASRSTSHVEPTESEANNAQ